MNLMFFQIVLQALQRGRAARRRSQARRAELQKQREEGWNGRIGGNDQERAKAATKIQVG